VRQRRHPVEPHTVGVVVKINSYLICATPRSGSTLLCGMLRSTEVAGRPESYFRLPDEASWADRWGIPRDDDGSFDYTDFVRAAATAGSTSNGVFAARIMWGTMDELVARLGTVHTDIAGSDLELLTKTFGRMRFVHLWRDDTLAQAVSWARAEQTSYWHPGDHRKPGPRPRFDFKQIHGLVHTIHEHNTAWRHWFTTWNISPYLIRYEDLAADPADTTKGILDYLGLDLPDDWAITPRDRRQADEINHDWIARYRTIASKV